MPGNIGGLGGEFANVTLSPSAKVEPPPVQFSAVVFQSPLLVFQVTSLAPGGGISEPDSVTLSNRQVPLTL